MGFFTARNRQNPFAERKRREAEQRATETAKEAVNAMAEAEAVNNEAKAQLASIAAPVDRNPDSPEYTQAPDISKFAEGGIVEAPKPVLVEPSTDEVHVPVAPEPIAIPAISAETQAKIDAVVNHAIPPIAEPESDAKRGRGRPRPQETIERDNAVHELLKAADAVEGVSKEALAISLGEKEQQVYSSLRQLTKEGRAENRYVKNHGYRWFAADEEN